MVESRDNALFWKEGNQIQKNIYNMHSPDLYLAEAKV